MEQLGQEQIDSILLEGGGTLNWSALESGIVQQVPVSYTHLDVYKRQEQRFGGVLIYQTQMRVRL